MLNQSPDQQLLILWDGATYHRYKEIRDFSASSYVNQKGDRSFIISENSDHTSFYVYQIAIAIV